MKKLLKEEQVKNEQELEQKYMERIMREPGLCKNPSRKEYQLFDVTKLGEGALQSRIIQGVGERRADCQCRRW